MCLGHIQHVAPLRAPSFIACIFTSLEVALGAAIWAQIRIHVATVAAPNSRSGHNPEPAVSHTHTTFPHYPPVDASPFPSLHPPNVTLHKSSIWVETVIL